MTALASSMRSARTSITDALAAESGYSSPRISAPSPIRLALLETLDAQLGEYHLLHAPVAPCCAASGADGISTAEPSSSSTPIPSVAFLQRSGAGGLSPGHRPVTVPSIDKGVGSGSFR